MNLNIVNILRFCTGKINKYLQMVMRSPQTPDKEKSVVDNKL
jgi:hypothetical protein